MLDAACLLAPPGVGVVLYVSVSGYMPFATTSPKISDSAMVKQPACAAAISSSGLVPLPSPKRATNEYGVSLSVALCVVSAPLPSLPLKGDYALRDMPRSARFLGIPLNFPTTFPIATQAPARAIYWVEQQAPDIVVVGNAISRGNVELEYILDQRIPFCSLPQILHDEFLCGKEVLVVEVGAVLTTFAVIYQIITGDPFGGGSETLLFTVTVTV